MTFEPDVVVIEIDHEGAQAFATELYGRGVPAIGVVGVTTYPERLQGAPLDVGLLTPYVGRDLVAAVADAFRIARSRQN